MANFLIPTVCQAPYETLDSYFIIKFAQRSHEICSVIRFMLPLKKQTQVTEVVSQGLTAGWWQSREPGRWMLVF